ncbi:3021_t:CDS:1 [Cetraspora pellucida]|uniref:3021_t:CDS:1 n=1 Tax=Cetraspora pellucida TaxID=1433469 RepID=A0ACA9LY95_9GLOM|nr:3021_t:CDS:1 [Cetraspora pellucida]
MFINTLVEGKIPVKALIDTSSKFNTISKSLFDKLGTDHGIGPTCDPVKNLYKDAIGEIRCLDLQFQYKRTYHSLDGTDTIDFEIHKNPPFDLVLGQGWLWVHEVKIIFGFSPRTYEHRGKIVIDGMSIPLIDEDFNKAGSSKNNPHKSDLSMEEITNIIKKILSDVEDNQSGSSDSHKSQHCRISSHQKKKRYRDAKIIKSVIVSKSDSSTSSSGSEDKHIYKTEVVGSKSHDSKNCPKACFAIRKHPILKCKVKGKVNYRAL